MVRPGDRRQVLRLITRLNIGGPARQALLLSRLLPPPYETLLAAGRPSAHEGELSDPEVDVTHVPLVRPVRPAHDVRALHAVRALIDQHRVDIVHTHMAKAGTVGRVAARLSRRRPRTVHTFHGHVLDGYFNRHVERAFIAAERRMAAWTDVFLAVSPEIRDQLLDLGIGRPEQFRVVSLGLDLSRFHGARADGKFRGALAVPPGVPLVGVVGRLVPIKDHATLFAAMVQVPEAHLAVVGDGELRSQLEDAAAGLGLRDRVHFTGWRVDMPGVMADLDVVVLSSLNEGTPVSLIEAGAGSRAVLATDVGGVRSVVTDGVNGMLVRPSDPVALATSLRMLLRDPDLRARMGVAGREASRAFDSARLVGELQRVYDDLFAN